MILIDTHIILYVNISAGMSKDDYSYHNIIRCCGQKPQNFRDVIRQQADILKQAVREQKTYQPFEWKGAGEQTECI